MESESPYVYRDEDEQRHEPRASDPAEREVVIVDGRAMSYRSYRR